MQQNGENDFSKWTHMEISPGAMHIQRTGRLFNRFEDFNINVSSFICA